MKYKLKENVTEEQLAECGFEFNDKYIYPKAITRQVGDTNLIKINRDNFCISAWDGKDKNSIGIVFLVNENIALCDYEEVKDYIADLIDKGYVEVVE